MYEGAKLLKNQVMENIQKVIDEKIGSDELISLFSQFIENENEDLKKSIVQLLEKERLDNDLLEKIYSMEQFMLDRTIWIIGGDGWAYDIGYGGLDHVLASGANINVLVLDTEVYSNTGGQASKASALGSVSKFAKGGKRTNKKDLAALMMTYENVYVAKIAMGANQNQTLRAIKEAYEYNGPSLIIAYSPCIEHGIKGGLMSQNEEKLAVECGYWQLFRYNPQLLEKGKNPLQIDFKNQIGINMNSF